MATVITHSVVALTFGSVYAKRRTTWLFWTSSIACSILPDFDVIAFAFGIPYEAFWGHRGITHSLTFAAIVGLLVVQFLSNRLVRPTPRKAWLFLYFFAVAASHGVLDAMTDGGLGIAFFSPFDTTRYFLPWRPIPVSPIGAAFFSQWGLEVLKSELIYLWLPCLAIWIVLRWISFRSAPRR